MQSGSDRILKAMHRPYKAQRFIDICDRVIVGYEDGAVEVLEIDDDEDDDAFV